MDAKKTAAKPKKKFASTLGLAGSTIIIREDGDKISIGVLRKEAKDGAAFTVTNISPSEAEKVGALLVGAAKANGPKEKAAYLDLTTSEAESVGKALESAAKTLRSKK